jgi:hypothetical protein
VVRPEISRRDLSSALLTLNAKEINREGQWERDNREMTSAVKFLDQSSGLTPSRLEPDQVVEVFAASAKLAVSSVV